MLEVARRLCADGVAASVDDLFLSLPEELSGFLGGGEGVPSELAKVIEKRRSEPARLARYTLLLTPYVEDPPPPAGNVIEGVPGSPGRAAGRAHIVRDTSLMDDIAGLREGDILVLLGEGKVGLTMFLPQIAGLVYENGNGICHESNICRELGKPSVVCLGANVCLLREGERLHIDGNQGNVVRLEQA